MKIAIFGSGYVGLVAAACFSDVGHDVVVIDINQERIDMVSSGVVPFYEPHLGTLLIKNIEAKRLTATLDASVISDCKFIIIAVGTPRQENSGSSDLSAVRKVYQTMAKYLRDDTTIVHKSTVPVGTAHTMQTYLKEQLQKQNRSMSFSIVSNPEFLKEGSAVDDFLKPDRIVVGADTLKAKESMEELYSHFNHNTSRIIFMDCISAECTKYAANAMLATKISFMNELSQITESCGANIDHIRRGIGSDQRIGPHFLYAGCGYGGSCFPKDIDSLISFAEEKGISPKLIESVREVNNLQKHALFARLKHVFSNKLEGKKVLLWGLSFKPDTDDVREAPSLVFIKAALAAGVAITAFDPVASDNALATLKDTNTPLDLLSISQHAYPEGAFDALVLATEWKEFRVPRWDVLQAIITGKVIIDGRNIYQPQTVAELGFLYKSIGR